MLKENVLSALLDQKILPLYYHQDANTCISILQALYDAGIRILEFTNRGENAIENFKSLKTYASDNLPGLYLGIGTIKTTNAADAFINAGADFIVCPTINPEVAKVAHQHNLLWIPGCMTPTEIALAEASGAQLVKIFPGNILGPSYISSIKELFPGIMFMPTGGVEAEEENLRSWFASGVVAVGMGSKLISRQLMEQQQWDELTSNTRKLLEMAGEVYSGKNK